MRSMRSALILCSLILFFACTKKPTTHNPGDEVILTERIEFVLQGGGGVIPITFGQAADILSNTSLILPSGVTVLARTTRLAPTIRKNALQTTLRLKLSHDISAGEKSIQLVL